MNLATLNQKMPHHDILDFLSKSLLIDDNITNFPRFSENMEIKVKFKTHGARSRGLFNIFRRGKRF